MSPLSPLRPVRNSGAEQREGLAARARDLRDRADSLLDMQSKLQTSSVNLDNRELQLSERENKLRQREAQLNQREAALKARETAQSQRESRALSETVEHRLEQSRALLHGEPLAQANTPTVAPTGTITDPVALAQQILAAGRIRRGEAAASVPLPTNPTARAVVLAGMARRCEIGDAELLADKIAGPLIRATTAREQTNTPSQSVPSPAVQDPKKLAADIVRAGAVRRGEISA